MPISARANLLAVALAMGLPTLVTWAYFVILAGQSTGLQQGIYAIGKTIQFAFPAVWTLLVLRERLTWPRLPSRGTWIGLLFGVGVGAAMLLLAWLWLQPHGLLTAPTRQIEAKIRDLGVDSRLRYVSLGLFYAVCHSLLEEYYWRWFVFRRLRDFVSLVPAISLSSVGFMAHHVILLATFFGWASPATYLLAAAVGVGGAFWAWLYDYSGSLLSPWLSHLIVDAAIFVLGYWLAHDLFG